MNLDSRFSKCKKLWVNEWDQKPRTAVASSWEALTICSAYTREDIVETD